MKKKNKISNGVRILAIETSCDETAIAVLEASGGIRQPKFRVLSNIVSSQVKIHAKWGGVVPNLAKREHIKNLPIVLKKALKEAKIINLNTIDAIAVTVGPGLEPALWVGINFAQDLYKKFKIKSLKLKIIGINHMEGHIVAALLKSKLKSQNSKVIEFPALALLVSGGHTELVLIRKWLDYKIIGQTRDDAAGEAFDKVAKMLGLPYPGGPSVAKMATKFKIKNLKLKINLPRPMINSKNYDFSFSGLKTAVLYLMRDIRVGKFDFRKIPLYDRLQGSQLPSPLIAVICREFQQAVIDVLISKTIRAAKEYKVKTIILGGGVAANKELRRQLTKTVKNQIPKFKFLIPNLEFTTDNAAMIAATAYLHLIERQTFNQVELKADGNLIL